MSLFPTLRQILSTTPTSEAWKELTSLFSSVQIHSIPEHELDLMLAYANEHMQDWPDELRVVWTDGFEEVPAYWPLVRSLHLNFLEPQLDYSQITQMCFGAFSVMTDLDSLKRYKNLRQLRFKKCKYYKLKNIDAIPFLSNLEILDLADAGPFDLVDLQLFRPLTSLRELYLPPSSLRDISTLKHMKKLEKLGLSLSEVKDIDVLVELEKLHFLDLSSNDYLRNVEPLAYMTNLSYLNMSFCANLEVKPSNYAEEMNEPWKILDYQQQIVSYYENN